MTAGRANHTPATMTAGRANHTPATMTAGRANHSPATMTAGRANHTPATMTAGTLLSSSQGMRLAAARGTFSSAVRELDCPPSPRGNGKSVIVLMQA